MTSASGASAPLRILLVHPGAAVSVHDVYEGLAAGLKMHGCEVIPYGLFGRVTSADRYLHYLWRHSKGTIEKPSWADVIYTASKDVLERATRLEVDVVLVVSGLYFHPDILELLRRAGVPSAVLFTESPYQIEQELRFAQFTDLCWTNERTVSGMFRRAVRGGRASYLPTGWHPYLHGPTAPDGDPSRPVRDVVFVGSGFKERIAFLEGVDWRGIDFGLYGGWDEVAKGSRLRRAIVRGPKGAGPLVPNAETAAIYRRAKVVVNLWRACGGAESMGPRLYEAAACGAFVVSEYRPEVVEKFGDLVPTFRTPAELEAVVRRWLADDVGRRQIAARLPAVVAEDSYFYRASRILGDLRELVERRAA